ncbi:MAG: ribonuclease Z [Bacteroidales bacterium]|nr:ribonuclease Z [Bacteroidales bacterium]
MTLGTASALPTANRYPSAHILTVRERLFLIDCGEGAQMQLRKAGVSIARIDNIFISHLHGDHIFGLFGLLSTLAMMGRTTPLYIYAPYRMEVILEFFKENFGEGIKYEIVHKPVRCKEPQMILDMKNLEVYTFPLQHRGETYGFLFKEKSPQRNIHKHLIEPYKLSLYEIARLKEGSDVVRSSQEILKSDEFTYLPYEPRVFAYCSDTAPFDELAQWVKGADLLYHEGTYGIELKDMASSTFHSTSSDAARCALQAGVKKLVIGHYSSRYKSIEPLVEQARSIFPQTYPAKEGANFDIPLRKYKQEK